MPLTPKPSVCCIQFQPICMPMEAASEPVRHHSRLSTSPNTKRLSIVTTITPALVRTLLAKESPLMAFRLWCDRLAELGRVKRGLATMLHATISDQDVHETYGLMVGAVRQLMEACESVGEIRSGADAEDVLTLLGVLWQIPPTPGGNARVGRLIAHVFRGLGVDELAEPSALR